MAEALQMLLDGHTAASVCERPVRRGGRLPSMGLAAVPRGLGDLKSLRSVMHRCVARVTPALHWPAGNVLQGSAMKLVTETRLLRVAVLVYGSGGLFPA